MDGDWNHPQLEQLLRRRHLLSPSGPLRPKTSLKEPAVPTGSSPFPYHCNTCFPRSFFLHILSFSPKTPHGRTQTRPHHTGSSASQTMPQPTPNCNPCHALHSPVSVPTSPWLSSPPLRFLYIHLFPSLFQNPSRSLIGLCDRV